MLQKKHNDVFIGMHRNLLQQGGMENLEGLGTVLYYGISCRWFESTFGLCDDKDGPVYGRYIWWDVVFFPDKSYINLPTWNRGKSLLAWERSASQSSVRSARQRLIRLHYDAP